MSATTERIYYEIDGDSRGLDRATRSGREDLESLDDAFKRAKSAAQAAAATIVCETVELIGQAAESSTTSLLEAVDLAGKHAAELSPSLPGVRP